MKTVVKLLASLFLLSLSAPAWAGDCPLDLGHGTGWVVFSDHYMLAFRPDPPVIEVGQPFALILNVCTRGGDAGELLSVESQMSEKAKVVGLQPSIVSDGNGRYRAEGMVFSEQGRWEVTFDVRTGQETERISHELIVK